MAVREGVRIGVSGWTYAPWRSAFYPPGLPQSRQLAYAATQFNAIEINGTFYGMQVPRSFAGWSEDAPPGFVFALKGPRYLTHMLKLTRPETPLANFFASGPLALGEKLGPILWQFPERFAFDETRLAAFFEMLPRTRGQAATLARRHDHRLRARPHFDVATDGPIRHAIEIRHESFRDPRFIALLRDHDIALVCADTPSWPLLMDVTSDFVYCRLHGSTQLYNSRYTDAELDRWAGRVRNWRMGLPMADGNFVLPPVVDGRPRDVFVFFDNTDKLEAPGNARDLMRRLGVAAAAASGSTAAA